MAGKFIEIRGWKESEVSLFGEALVTGNMSSLAAGRREEYRAEGIATGRKLGLRSGRSNGQAGFCWLRFLFCADLMEVT